MKTIIGIDPDAGKHGVALYQGGKLIHLQMMTTIELMIAYMDTPDEVVFSIENVMANQFIYSRNNQGNKAVTSKIAIAVGRCQQAQVELMRMLEHKNIDYVLHKPTKNNWATRREVFEAVTGWEGQSNQDTRSAAYFGYLDAKLLQRKRG